MVYKREVEIKCRKKSRVRKQREKYNEKVKIEETDSMFEMEKVERVSRVRKSPKKVLNENKEKVDYETGETESK